MDQNLRPPTLREAVRGSLKIRHALRSGCTAQVRCNNVADIGPGPHYRRNRQPDYSVVPGNVAQAEFSSATMCLQQASHQYGLERSENALPDIWFWGDSTCTITAALTR